MPSSGVQTCARSEEHTSELQSHDNIVCRLLLEKKKNVPHGELRLRPHTLTWKRPPHMRPPHAAKQKTPPPPLPPLRPPPTRPSLSFFFNDPAPPEIYPLSLHDPFPI